MREVEDTCLAMLARDNDGYMIIDYLGPKFYSDFESSIPHAELRDSLDWARSEASRFEAKGNRKIASKYYRLATYLQARLPLWVTGESGG